MAKKLTIEQWTKACEKVIDAGDCDGLRNVLESLNEEDRYMGIPCMEHVMKYAAEHGDMQMIQEILGCRGFSGMESYLVKVALEQEKEELLKLALENVNPNVLLHGVFYELEETDDQEESENLGEGKSYYLISEPLAACAIRGKVELAKILLEAGARPEGINAADLMGKEARSLRAFIQPRLEIHMRWTKGDIQGMERCSGLKRLPPWAYGMFCRDLEAAEFFLSLGEDRWSLELAMAVSMVSDGEIIRILQEKKPKLMAELKPKFILRRFWPEAVKQYFSAGHEIPENAVALMGTYLFEDYDMRNCDNGLMDREFREDDFVDTLKYLLKQGYRMTKEDLERLTMWMVLFHSERLLKFLKGKVPKETDVSGWLDFLPVEEKAWPFGKKLLEEGVRFRCVIDDNFKCYSTKNYLELNRLFKLVTFEVRQPEKLDCMSASALFGRSKRSMALLWKHGLINPQNLSQAVKLICDLQLTELYEFSAELAGTMGGSEVRYEL